MKSFNRKFTEWRAHIINDSNLELEKKEKALSTFVSHHCFLHIIINLGDDACKNGLSNLDKCSVNNDALGDLSLKGSSTTYTAIYAAARCFHQQGSEKYGQSSLSDAFIHQENEKDSQKKPSSRKGT